MVGPHPSLGEERVGTELEAGVLRRFSGHSIRVGTAQDLIAGGQEIAAIAQAGGWKDVKMVLRYGERLLTDRRAVARAEAERSVSS
jgi:integrase